MNVTRILTTAAVSIFITGLLGCSASSSEENIRPPVSKSIELKSFTSCAEAETFAREALKEKMNKRLEEEAGKCFNNYNYGDVMPSASESTDESVTFSETNNQESGIDEADIYKTGGNFTYLLADGKLKVVRTAPVTSLGEVASIEIEGAPYSLYLIGNKVVFFSGIQNLPTQTIGSNTSINKASSPDYVAMSGMMMTGDMAGIGHLPNTKVTVIDVTTPTTPSITRESYYSGSFNSARRIGDRVFVITSPSLTIPVTNTYVSDYKLYPECGDDGKPKSAPSATLLAAIAKLKEENLAKINNWKLSNNLLPSVHKRAGKTISQNSSCSAISRSEASFGNSFVGINTISPNGTEASDSSEFVLGGAGTVYANSNSIYVATPNENSSKTIIHRFALGASKAIPTYFGSTELDGWVLNQFSLSEFNGDLRVATTRGVANKSGETVESMVSVINATEEGMPIIGEVAGIGAGEQIKSVRFIGERGFVVTFKKIDPLFVLDLSDPMNPFVAGELKIPGFSTYLHPLDENHLIGLGKDADDQGVFAWFQGMKISIFDVTNSANPKEDDSIIIGDRGTMSPAIDEHLAFTFDADKGMLALPITLCEGATGASDTGDFEYNGAQVYNVSANNGISLKSELKEQTEPENPVNDYGYSQECNGWSYYGKVQRTIFMTDVSGKTHIVMMKTDGLSIYTDTGVKEKAISW